MNFTHHNHLKYFINDKLFGSRESSIEKFKVSLGKIDIDYYKKTNFNLELIRIADLVYKDFGKNFALFLSGGTDSEIVARNFLSIGIKPTCFTIKFKNDYNIDDVNAAIEIAKELDLPHHLIEFDVKEFFYSGNALEFGGELQCSQITYLTVYYCIKKLGLPSIMGGELLLRRNINTVPSSWYYCFRENEDASAMRFSKKYNLPLVNEWFSYTPEVMLNYLENKDIKNLVGNKHNYKLSSVSSKNQILKSLIPEIKLRIKTHGFEKLLAFNFEVYRKLLGTQIMRLERSLDGVEYYDCIKMLKGE